MNGVSTDRDTETHELTLAREGGSDKAVIGSLAGTARERRHGFVSPSDRHRAET
jgi:hypothetical protein